MQPNASMGLGVTRREAKESHRVCACGWQAEVGRVAGGEGALLSPHRHPPPPENKETKEEPEIKTKRLTAL